MIRDGKMMQLVAADKEPITPFLSIVRSLYDDKCISTVMVVGGVGDYFDVADNVLVMDSYCCNDATERAKQIVACSKSSLPHNACPSVSFRDIQMRSVVVSHFVANGKVKTLSKSTISYGETELDISGLEQLASVAQTTAIANALQRIPSLAQQSLSLRAVLGAIEQNMNAEGLNCLAPGQYHGGMARPRRFEIAGAINRLRRAQSIIQTNCKS
jgi:predicted ABC-class ATPase